MQYSKEILVNKNTLLHTTYKKRMSDFHEYITKIQRFHKITCDYQADLTILQKDLIGMKIYNGNQPILETTITSFRVYIDRCRQSFGEFTANIKKDIIDVSNAFYEEKNNEEKALYQELNKMENEYTSIIHAYDKSYNKFQDALKTYETILTDYQLKGRPKEMDDSVQSKSLGAKESELLYQSNITKANKFREKYNVLAEKILNKYQDLDLHIVNMVQRNEANVAVLTSYHNSNLKNNNDLYKEKSNVTDYKTLYSPDSLFDPISFTPVVFQPYQLRVFQASDGKKLNEDMTYEVVSNMQSKFTQIATNYNSAEEFNKNQILRISRFICQTNHKDPLSEKDWDFIHTLFKENKYRMVFLSYLNNKRVSGNFNICKESFKQLGDLMYYIIDCVSEDKDFESMRYCLIMCHTYWFTNREKKKIYLHHKIDQHPIFQTNEFWEFFFSDSLYQKIDKQSKLKVDKESDEEKSHRMSNIAFTELISLANSMIDFNVDKEKIKKMIKIFATQYSVPEKKVVDIDNMIEETPYDNAIPFNEEVDLIEPDVFEPIEPEPIETSNTTQKTFNMLLSFINPFN